VDAELFYRLHIDRFLQPERRRVRHILVTINDSFAENDSDAARQRIEVIAARLAKEPGRFTEQALKHSECPTALQGGLLGEYPRGQLFAALDGALFRLKEGETSAILESPLGFHLLRCEAILPPGAVPFQEALPRIRRMIADQRARGIQRTWLRRVLQEGSPQPQAATAGTA
jgi:nitrogen fixation protein NifM